MQVSFYKRNTSVYIHIRVNKVKIRKNVGIKTDRELVGNSIPGDKPGTYVLQSLKLCLEDFELKCRRERITITEELVLREYKKLRNGDEYEDEKPAPQKDIWQYWDEWVEECETKISPVTKRPYAKGTIAHYRKVKNILTAFQFKEKFTVDIHSISSDAFYIKFTKHIVKKGQSINTLADHIKHIKTFCKWLQKRENISNHFRDFQKHNFYADAEPLKENELSLLYEAKFTGHLEKARLVLLFLCSTGMRISDYNNISESNIVGEFMIFKSQKTNSTCYVPWFDDINFRPVYLYSKLKADYKTIKISGQKLNTYIKEIAERLGIKRIIPTSKTGRKTFATLKLLSGVAPEIIMKSTGHKTRASFDSYVGIDTSDILKAYKDKAVNLKVG